MVRFPNRTGFVSIAFINVFAKDPSEYAFGILNWLGNRTYRPGKITTER